MNKMNELVLCVPAKAFDDLETFVEKERVWKPRRIAEYDENFRHIIPYCILLNPRSRRILAYQRQGGNEKRLAGQWSIGIGGHVNVEDGAGWDAVLKARDRECQEELGIKPRRTWGDIFISLDSTPVDRVHLGYCQIITDYSGTLRPSKEIPEWQMLTIEELRERNLETWSVYVLDRLEEDFSALIKRAG